MIIKTIFGRNATLDLPTTMATKSIKETDLPEIFEKKLLKRTKKDLHFSKLRFKYLG